MLTKTSVANDRILQFDHQNHFFKIRRIPRRTPVLPPAKPDSSLRVSFSKSFNQLTLKFFFSPAIRDSSARNLLGLPLLSVRAQLGTQCPGRSSLQTGGG